MGAVLKRLTELTAHEIDFWRRATALSANKETGFHQYEFAVAVDKVNANVFVGVGEIDSELSWLLPLQCNLSMAGMLKSWSRLGAEMSDYFELIQLNMTHNVPMQMALAQLNINFMEYSHLPAGLYSKKQSGIDFASKIILPKNSDDYFAWLKSSNKKFFSDTIRREKKLVKEHGEISFEFNTQSSDDLELLIEAKTSQYQRTEVNNVFAKPENQDLLRRLLKDNGQSLNTGDFQCVISKLSVNGQWIALHIGLMSHGTLNYWFPVYHPEFRNYAPGRLLLFHVIRAAAANQVSRIDRGQGLSDSKKETANYIHLMKKDFYKSQTIAATFYHLVSALKWRLKK